jgi:superfamily I DNA and/or RNA helicase
MSRRYKRRQTSDHSDEHFIRMAEWIAMESAAEVRQMAERRVRRRQSDAEKSGETILDLAIEDHQSGLGGRFLLTLVKRNRQQPMPWHRLKVGSPIVLSNQRQDDGDSLTGVVSERTSDSLQVSVDHFPEGDSFRVDLTADEVTRQRQLAAIMTAKDSRGRLGQLRKVLLGEAEPEFSEEPEIEFQTDLNPSQQAAVRFGLSAREVGIIHGPPGTGKTTTVVELIIQAVKRGDKVLACGPSNTSVDNLLERLVDAGQNVVRVGHPARVAERLREFSLDGLVEKHDDISVVHEMLREAEGLYRKASRYTRARPARGEKQDLRREARQLKQHARLLEKQLVNHILDRAHVICATTTFNEELIGDREFDLLVIDEACQSVEPGCWIPLIRCDKLILAGDQCQLPPTVLSQDAARQGFERSLLERVNGIHGQKITRMLDVQYRMHREIMDFSSSQFYEGKLIAHDSVREHLLSDIQSVVATELTQGPVTFIDTAGAGWDEQLEPEGESRFNPREAELTVTKVIQLCEAGLSPADIAVIAPYAAQVRWLKDLFRTAEFDTAGLEVDTVDGFQGREKEAVVISTVRSNATGEIGFLGDRRRMNVALTRARRKLIVIGDSATLGGNEFFAAMLAYFERIGAYQSVWSENFHVE